ncbi:MAG TPA: Na-translocating system protein MpsB, partial [Kouleothrix sp.]|nr:Na-translocating system protein MpsB [Kouleothrix sp.]
MLELAETTTRPVAGMRHDPAADLWNDVVAVCRRIPPLWPLGEYVAVNPFLGFAGRPLAEAARIVRDGLGGQVLPGIEFYRARWRVEEV